ncbi:MAG: hypothetical protein ACJAS4_001842 [Bacteriovoracaceae bacterium]|jgi:hypothetical protein
MPVSINIEIDRIDKRFDHLLKLISSERFLNKEGLGNEVPFFICPFDPKETNEMIKVQEQLINQLKKQGRTVLNINLYDLAIEILEKDEIFETILEQEEELEKDELKELLQNTLDPEQSIIPMIAKKMKELSFDIMFITGVGEVFPFIRSHSILNNLQSTAEEKPTVMFFPGEYTQCNSKGSSLDLFKRLRDDKYYRAFNIFHCEI